MLVHYAVKIIGENEGSFRQGITNIDQIITVRRILKKCWEQNVDVHHLRVFIDFPVEYDTAWRKEIKSGVHTLYFPTFFTK
jgi:hypothetical protein